MRNFCESAKRGRKCGDDLCYGGDQTLCGFDKDEYDEICRESEEPDYGDGDGGWE